jgi:hypothetical protein
MRAYPSHEALAVPHDSRASRAEVQPVLQRTARSLDRGGTSLVELALYIHRIHQRPAEAERLLEEGAAKALSTLEDAWAGLIRVLTEQCKLEQALELGELAVRTFPDSSRIAEAVEAARGAVPPARPPSPQEA